MIELLLKYYNNEEGNVELIGCIAEVIEIFCKWQQYGQINSQSLLNFIIDQVILIVGEVKNKLIVKAIDKFDLLSSQMKSETEGAPSGPMGEAPGPAPFDSAQAPESAVESLSAPGAPGGPIVEDFAQNWQQSTQYVKDYRDSPQDFDQMLITIWNYFELINQNSAKIEDLWLNMLEILQIPRPNKYTVFKAVHHQAFRNCVLKDPLIR